MIERNLYKALQHRKEKGEELNWVSITPNELEELFCVEVLTDGIIADLYGVEKKVVTSQRKKWDISDRSYRTKKAISIYKEEVATSLNDSPLSYDHDIAKYSMVDKIVRDIQNLTEEDHERLIGYLIKTNDTLSSMARDNIRYKAFFKAHTADV